MTEADTYGMTSKKSKAKCRGLSTAQLTIML